MSKKFFFVVIKSTFWLVYLNSPLNQELLHGKKSFLFFFVLSMWCVIIWFIERIQYIFLKWMRKRKTQDSAVNIILKSQVSSNMFRYSDWIHTDLYICLLVLNSRMEVIVKEISSILYLCFFIILGSLFGFM